MEMVAFYNVIIASALACLVSGKIYLDNQNLYYGYVLRSAVKRRMKECEQNNTIVITANTSTSYGSVHAVGTSSNGTNSTCAVTQQNNTVVTFAITNCNVTSTIKVYLMEEKQTTNFTVLGGKGLAIYELKCTGINKGGTNITKVFNLTDGETFTVQPHYQSEVHLMMEIADNNNMTINTSSNVHIGDRLRLIISGNDKFKFTAQSCEATDAAAKSHVKQLTHDGITDDESVISNFSLLQNYSGHNRSVKIEATLYAFHFIDSNSIVITCTITVCELDDDNCHLKQTGNGKRRRATGVEPYTHSLQTTLRVIDNERKVATTNGGSETSGASGVSNWLFVPMLSCLLSAIVEFRA